MPKMPHFICFMIEIMIAAIVVTSFAVNRGQKCTAGGNMALNRATDKHLYCHKRVTW